MLHTFFCSDQMVHKNISCECVPFLGSELGGSNAGFRISKGHSSQGWLRPQGGCQVRAAGLGGAQCQPQSLGLLEDLVSARGLPASLRHLAGPGLGLSPEPVSIPSPLHREA